MKTEAEVKARLSQLLSELEELKGKGDIETLRPKLLAIVNESKELSNYVKLLKFETPTTANQIN